MFAFEEVTDLREPLLAIANGPTTYRRVARTRSTFEARSPEASIRISILADDRICVKLPSAGEERSYTISLDFSDPAPSLWADFCGLIPALHAAAESGAPLVDVSAQTLMLRLLIEKTRVATIDNVLLTPAQERALCYLRAASGIAAPWSLNLSGLISIAAITQALGELFHFNLWTGPAWELPNPLNELMPTIRVSTVQGAPHNITVSQGTYDSWTVVKLHEGLDRMKAIRDLDEFFGSTEIAEGLIQFANELRETLQLTF